jgi:MerR family transcriptional regulator, copper efflux regulator
MLSIGQVAKRTGVAVDTIRFYEKERLLGKPPRSAGGYREYDQETVRVLRFILRAKHLGFTLSEVKELLPRARPEQTRRHPGPDREP